MTNFFNEIFSKLFFYLSGLIKKIIQYAKSDLLKTLCETFEQNLGTLIVEVVASVLDNEVSTFFELIYV